MLKPIFANITPYKGKSGERVLHEITDIELKRFTASEGENYDLVDIKVPFFNCLITAKTLIYETVITSDLPKSKRYQRSLIKAAE